MSLWLWYWESSVSYTHLDVYKRHLEDEAVDKAVETWMNWTKYDYPKDTAICQSRYCADFEQWWREPRPLIAEW